MCTLYVYQCFIAAIIVEIWWTGHWLSIGKYKCRVSLNKSRNTNPLVLYPLKSQHILIFPGVNQYWKYRTLCCILKAKPSSPSSCPCQVWQTTITQQLYQSFHRLLFLKFETSVLFLLFTPSKPKTFLF